MIGTRFNYDGAGRIWMVVTDTFEWDGDPENVPAKHVKLAVREFQYHSGRARYLMRDRDPESLSPLGARSEPRPSGSGQRQIVTAVSFERGPLPHGRGSD